jgi:hypothetical protein
MTEQDRYENNVCVDFDPKAKYVYDVCPFLLITRHPEYDSEDILELMPHREATEFSCVLGYECDLKENNMVVGKCKLVEVITTEKILFRRTVKNLIYEKEHTKPIRKICKMCGNEFDSYGDDICVDCELPF